MDHEYGPNHEDHKKKDVPLMPVKESVHIEDTQVLIEDVYVFIEDMYALMQRTPTSLAMHHF